MFINKTFQLYFLKQKRIWFSSVQSLSCVWPCNPIDCSTPGFPVHHQLLEFAQIHVHRVGDAIQPSHPLSSPSPPSLNLSQHQGLFQWVSSSHQVANVLEFQLKHQCQRILIRRYVDTWNWHYLWKCCIQYASKFGKLTRGHRTQKIQFSFQSQRKAMPKNAQTTAHLHSSHTLVK